MYILYKPINLFKGQIVLWDTMLHIRSISVCVTEQRFRISLR